MIDIDKNILPGVGLGGITIGQSVAELGLGRNEVQEVNGNKFYACAGGAITVFFSDDYRVTRVSALAGYAGSLPGDVRVGSSISHLESLGWRFDECDDGFSHLKYPGTVVRANLEDASDVEIASSAASLCVEEITVFAQY